MKKNSTDYAAQLFAAISCLETAEECQAFFSDLCTYQEINSFAQRFQVAKMLKQKCQYNEIAQETGASSATISRVNRSLHYSENGYEIVFERLEGK